MPRLLPTAVLTGAVVLVGRTASEPDRGRVGSAAQPAAQSAVPSAAAPAVGSAPPARAPGVTLRAAAPQTCAAGAAARPAASGLVGAPGAPVALSTDTITVRVVAPVPARDYTPVLIALASVGVSAGVTVFATRAALEQKDRELAQAFGLKQAELDRTIGLRVREQQRAELLRRLTIFYGPLKQQLDVSRVLYERLRAGPAASAIPEYRTLLALLDPTLRATFSPNDWVLIREIVAATDEVRTLLAAGQGLAETAALSNALADAQAHFRLLALATKGELTGETTRFASSTFPRDLDDLVRAEIAGVQARIRDLERADTAATDVRVAPTRTPSLPWWRAPWWRGRASRPPAPGAATPTADVPPAGALTGDAGA